MRNSVKNIPLYCILTHPEQDRRL